VPEQKNAWDIEQLQNWKKELMQKMGKLETRVEEHETFKATTIQQLLVVFKTLDELKEGDKWLRRMFITALVGTALTAIGALLVWAIQN